MTKKFDEQARQELMAYYQKKDYSNVKPKQIVVKQITCKQARPYIASFHYSKTMPDSSRFIFGAFAGEDLVGVCVFGMGCGKNQFTSIWKDAVNGQYLELTRLWLEDTLGKNHESHFIAESMKRLPKEIRMVISFSDESRGHIGYIYQATNFTYLGKNGGGKMLLDTNTGVESHPRLLGIYRMRHPELRDIGNDELMNMLSLVYVRGGAKYKYVFFRDKRLGKHLGIKGERYPKADKTG